MEPKIIALMAAADEGYAIPMTVALHSALASLSKSVSVKIFLVDNGISQTKRHKCNKSLNSAHPNVSIYWSSPNLSEFAKLEREHMTTTTFGRIFVSEIVTPDVERILYIDCDVVVGDDIAKLWDIDMTDLALMAALDGPGSDFNTLISSKFPEIGAPVDAPYFNSGVMLINLPEWRKQDIMGKSVSFLRKHGHETRFRDQCALNAVSVGLWRPLDLWWNTQVHDNIGKKLTEFGILHYTVFKPWVPSSKTAMADHYFKAYRRAGIDGPIADWITTTKLACTQAYLRWAQRADHRAKRRLKRWVGQSD